MHISKTGTSFLNTLVHIPGVCPDLPDDADVGTVPSEMLLGAHVWFFHHYDLLSAC